MKIFIQEYHGAFSKKVVLWSGHCRIEDFLQNWLWMRFFPVKFEWTKRRELKMGGEIFNRMKCCLHGSRNDDFVIINLMIFFASKKLKCHLAYSIYECYGTTYSTTVTAYWTPLQQIIQLLSHSLPPLFESERDLSVRNRKQDMNRVDGIYKGRLRVVTVCLVRISIVRPRCIMRISSSSLQII